MVGGGQKRTSGYSYLTENSPRIMTLKWMGHPHLARMPDGVEKILTNISFKLKRMTDKVRTDGASIFYIFSRCDNGLIILGVFTVKK